MVMAWAGDGDGIGGADVVLGADPTDVPQAEGEVGFVGAGDRDSRRRMERTAWAAVKTAVLAAVGHL